MMCKECCCVKSTCTSTVRNFEIIYGKNGAVCLYHRIAQEYYVSRLRNIIFASLFMQMKSYQENYASQVLFRKIPFSLVRYVSAIKYICHRIQNFLYQYKECLYISILLSQEFSDTEPYESPYSFPDLHNSFEITFSRLAETISGSASQSSCGQNCNQ